MAARLLAAAALAAAAVSAVPADAALIPPVCTVALAAVTAGESSSCQTSRVGPTTSAGGWTRTVTLNVTSGAARLAYQCGVNGGIRTLSVTAPGTSTFTVWDSPTCTVTVTSTAPLTTAVATSTTSYRISPY